MFNVRVFSTGGRGESPPPAENLLIPTPSSHLENPPPNIYSPIPKVNLLPLNNNFQVINQ